MSAIAGLIHKDGAVASLATLQAMQKPLAAWGNDRSSIRTDGPAGFAHVLMINTPQARFEQQPYSDPAAGHVMIVADARLDNRDELLLDLKHGGEDGAKLPDSVLLLRAHELWGDSCVDHLRGAFAFAIWNVRKQELFCVRDHLGCRPLYYYDGATRFGFATSEEALLQLANVSAELDPLALVAPVLNAYTYLRDHALHRAIAKLPAGHCLHLQHGVLRRARYWRPENLPRTRHGDAALHAKKLQELLRDSVASQTRAVTPVGSHLSGGMDSAAVTVLAARHLRSIGKRLGPTYSWSPPPPANLAANDERGRIALLCEREALTCRFMRITPEHVNDHVMRVVGSRPAETLLHESVVCETAAADGVRVILTGWGGDEFASFNGRGAWAEHFWRGRWLALLKRIASPHGRHSRVKAAMSEILLTALPDSLYRALGRDTPAVFRRALALGTLQHDMLTRDELRILREATMDARLRASVRDNMLAQLRHGHLSRRMEDWAAEGARHGVEYRHPLLDRRVVEYCLTLPASSYMCNGFPRCLMRAAICDLLPADWRWQDTKSEPAKISTQHAAMDSAWKAEPTQLPAATSQAALRAHHLAALRHRVVAQQR